MEPTRRGLLLGSAAAAFMAALPEIALPPALPKARALLMHSREPLSTVDVRRDA